MTKKIFRSIFLVAFIVLAACLVLITGALYSYFASEQSDQLAMQARLAAQAVEDEGLDYFDGLATGDLRLTWIAADGSVLYDTDADADLMENHSTREEFTEALSTGHGESSRYSSTLSEETLYQAVLLSDGTVLRASASHRTVFALVFGMLLPLILIMAAAVLLASYLASRLSKRIVGPLNAIDLDDPLSNDVYDELSPLLTRVEQQKEQIASQIEELNRRREEFSAVTDNMSEGLILLDHEGMILSINPSAARIFSAGSDCIGNDILTLDRSPELRALMESADAGRHGETVIERDGAEYQLSASPVLTDGVSRGTVLLAFDVTEKLRAERLRREFTANVSHELKTPLHSIMGAAELLQDGLVKKEDQQRFLGRIRSEAERLVALVDDVIDLSRMDEGESFPRENTDMLQLARDVAGDLAPAAEKRSISINVTGEGGTVRGVRRLLWEIVWNLCDNAVKYGREGGHVDVSVARAGNGGVALCVADDGIGIPAEHRLRVFERFYRVDKSHSRATGGTGLGLSIVKHAAQYHNADIALESEEGRGTKITVTFPAEDAQG